MSLFSGEHTVNQHLDGTPVISLPAGIQATTLDATGAATLHSTLAVTGAASLSSDLAVTGNETVGGTLAVTGATTLTGQVNLNGTIKVGQSILPTAGSSAGYIEITIGSTVYKIQIYAVS